MKKNIFKYILIIALLSNGNSFASETIWTINTWLSNSSINLNLPCPITTVSNWVVNSNTCAITCNSWYTISWNNCNANIISSWWWGWWGWGWSFFNYNSITNTWIIVDSLIWIKEILPINNNNWNNKPNNNFTDINDSFAKEYILALFSKWITNGYNDNTFRPNTNIKRAEFLKMTLLWAKIDYKNANTSNVTFSDVDKKSWEAKVISKAIELKYINTTNKIFRPNDYINRSEAIKLIINATWINLIDTDYTLFSDVKEKWMKKYINWALRLNIISKSDKFRPMNFITRAEVAKIVYNAFVKIK